MSERDLQSVEETQPTGIVTTIGERCKRCYTCVRYCPAKAIRVQDGRAMVLPERCVACGNCIRVCAQNAKRVESDDLERTQRMLESGQHVVACLAPSFPASFGTVKPLQVVEATRRLGFAQVMEVAVGAELTAHAYKVLLASGDGDGPIISTPCPALVSYVEKHVPGLLPYLAPIVSPMVALGRLIKCRLNPEAKVVFIGPCLAKKVEARDPCLDDEVDAVLTFREFTDWLAEAGIEMDKVPESEFDPPHPSIGRIFPVPGGLLRASEMEMDVLDDDIVVTEGVDRVTDLLKQIDSGQVNSRFFDLLFCEGCISGPFAGGVGNTVAMKQKVANYTRAQISRGKVSDLGPYFDLDMTRQFTDCHISSKEPTEEQIAKILRHIDKYGPEDELNCGACGYPTCREKAVAVFNGLAEPEMCLPYLINKLEQTIAELSDSRRNLIDTQEQLMQSEKLASMGQLAAGVAHEINNPLGTVLIYAHMLLKSLEEDDSRREDLEMITRQADRCRNIVRGLLDFSRQSKLNDEPTNLNDIIRTKVQLLSKQDQFANINIETDLRSDLPQTLIDREQMRQLFINLLQNAAEAMPEGGLIRVRTDVSPDGHCVLTEISDTGVGIPQENLDKLFHPFFTTKQIGKGTGLGLAIVYGIVKMHRGSISVDSTAGQGTTFTISLPIITTSDERGEQGLHWPSEAGNS